MVHVHAWENHTCKLQQLGCSVMFAGVCHRKIAMIMPRVGCLKVLSIIEKYPVSNGDNTEYVLLCKFLLDLVSEMAMGLPATPITSAILLACCLCLPVEARKQEDEKDIVSMVSALAGEVEWLKEENEKQKTVNGMLGMENKELKMVVQELRKELMEKITSNDYFSMSHITNIS